MDILNTTTDFNVVLIATTVDISDNTNSYALIFPFFLSRVSILLLTRDIDIAILSVRLSVRLSLRDTLVLYENGLTYRHSFSTVR